MVKTPSVSQEPFIPTATRYSLVEHVRGVIRDLDGGSFSRPALLVEQMRWNARLRGIQDARWNALMSTTIQWEPGRDSAEGRKAAEAIVEDWPLIATEATRKQNHAWGIDLGVSFAQKHWYVSEYSGRLIPRLQVYHPTFAYWDWTARCYRIHTADNESVEVQSPSLQRQRPTGLGTWVVHEPWGQHSWRNGLIHAAWYSWLGHEWASRDESRDSEKKGLGLIKLIVPHGADKEKVERLKRGMRALNSEGVITLEELEDGRKFDAQPLEWSGAGTESIHKTKYSKAVDLAVLYTGHNLSVEMKGGGSYAAIDGALRVRDDITVWDGKCERTTYGEQVIADWAEANFGEPELAPQMCHETDPPQVNEAAARTLVQVSQSLPNFARSAPQVDIDALLARFRVPLRVAGKQTEEPKPMPMPIPTDPAAVAPVPDTSAAPAEKTAAADATLAITPTDLASIVTVNEGRKSVGLVSVGDGVGGKWIREHAAELAAKLPSETGAPAPPSPAPPAPKEP